MKTPPHMFTLTQLISRNLSAVCLAALFMSLPSLHAVEFGHKYVGDTPPGESDLIQESRKNGGGEVENVNGRLKVTVPVGTSHFFNVNGGPGQSYDGSSATGTTLDFSLAVEGKNPNQAVFAIRVGNGEFSWHLVFYPEMVRIGSQEIPHDVRKMDTYRMAFVGDKLSVYSARSGELASEVRPEKKLGDNKVSFGTRSSIEVSEPVSWELGFIRWTNKEAVFSRPEGK